MTSRSSSTAGVLASVLAWLPRGDALPDDVWRRRHRGILLFAWAHVPILVVATVVETGSWTDALLNGVSAGSLAAAGSLPGLSRRVLASAVTLSLLTSTALLIHVFDGLIEIHFHFFVVIAVIAMYQQWTPYLIGLGYVLVHHALMGVMMPTAVYNHPAAIAHPVLFAAIHGGFVLAESAACLAYWKLNEEALDGEREQRERAEESNAALERANSELGDLMAMLSHDLRGPLTVINGAAELAAEAWDDLGDAAKQDLMRRISSSGRTLDRMLEETLTLSALDGAGLQAWPVATNLDEFIQPLLVTNFGDLDLVTEGLSTASVLADRQHLAQIVTNVVSNAAKYGSPPYAVTAAASGDTVSLTITDAGGGVPAGFVPRLFERYSRADEARSGGQKGTGLGLYIVRALVEANGGSIAYRPLRPTGAAFEVRLPRALGPSVETPRLLSTAVERPNAC